MRIPGPLVLLAAKSQVGFRQVDPPPRGSKCGSGSVPHSHDKTVANMPRESFGVVTSHELRFTTDATAELTAFLVWVEEHLRPDGSLASLSGWGNKLGGLCVRFCGILRSGRDRDRRPVDGYTHQRGGGQAPCGCAASTRFRMR